MVTSPRVILRQLWDRDAYGLWIAEESNGKIKYLKAVTIEYQEPMNEGMFLPEPTVVIPRTVSKMVFEQFVQELEMQGESATNTKQVIDAKNENLKDLRHIIDSMFTHAKAKHHLTDRKGEE